MEIQREAYLNQLIERRDNGMIKIVTGIRRCGKSYLLFTIFKRYLLESGVPEDHIIEIALDGIENEELRDPKVCCRYITDAMRGDGPYYLLLDEVQFMPRFEEVLNSLLRLSNIDVYVTGSNSKFLSSDIVTEFRGRGDEIRIHPLSFAEFYSVWDGDFDDAWDEYMLYGGLPQILNFLNERQKADYLKNIFANVFLKDVIERNRIQNDAEINILVDVLASAIGAPTNPSKIANTFASERQMSYTNKTISQHIDFLADAFQIEKAQRYDIKGRKYIGANLKYYFTDLGLRNARLNFRLISWRTSYIMSCAFAVIMAMWVALRRSARTAAASACASSSKSISSSIRRVSDIISRSPTISPRRRSRRRNSTRSAISRTRSRKSSSYTASANRGATMKASLSWA